ncbi:MAG: ArsC family reductase [Proteobacteria bacterium]|nr:ArsC family reductase [Pseudomonadota bacterium]
MTILYGIPNCDTVRKARKWLVAHNIDYRFHDFRKEGLPANRLRKWVAAVGWEALLNRRGLGWRKLPETEKAGINQGAAIKLMLADPTLIKRPVLEHASQFQVGFSEAAYQQLFN